MLSTRDSLQTQEHIQTETEGMEKDTPCKWKPNIVTDNIDFKTKTITTDKEGHYMVTKGSIQ